MTTKLEIYDPPMCCPTGVCGVEPDERLARFAADLEWLRSQGVEVRRYNLAQEPAAFVSNSDVQRILAETEGAGLPVVIADGRVASRGEYPARERLAEFAGLPMDVSLIDDRVGATAAPPDGACCGGAPGCC